MFDQNEMSGSLHDINMKNILQTEFIEIIKAKRSWIFSGKINAQKINNKYLVQMREARINVNRIKDFNYEFPVCMSIPTFLSIQSQKFFSLYNCSNCKYTWMLFQRYVREMVLGSWYLLIEKAEKKYSQSHENKPFKVFLKSESEILCRWILIYLPESEDTYDVIPTFMHIFNLVVRSYQNSILHSLSNNLYIFLKEYGNKSFCTFNFGFKPFALLDESGARISTLDGSDQKN